MQQNIRWECPKCGRPLEKFNGKIGYCSLHKWVSPMGLGYEAEAAEQNRMDAEAEEQSRLMQQRQKAEAEGQEIIVRHQKFVHKLIAGCIIFMAAAAAIFFLLVLPNNNYHTAADKFASGEFEAAKNDYNALGNYKDSSDRVILCEMIIDLQESRLEEAANKLALLTDKNRGTLPAEISEDVQHVITDWKINDLTPEALLLMLGKSEIIDPNGKLDRAKLTEEGHTALLDGTQLAVYTGDVNKDGNPELIVLNADYSVTVYRMSEDNNQRIAVDNEILSACEMHFGNQYKNIDANLSVSCFSEAYRLSPGNDTRSALTDAYQFRSAQYEDSGDMDSAIADARSALETAGTADAFTFFYDINLRNCRIGHNLAEAIPMWDKFAADSGMELTRFSANDRWQSDAAQLHIERAAELAAQKDNGCIMELRTAEGLGADITGAVTDAESYFEPGLTLANLRVLEMDLSGTDAAKEQQIRSDMSDEIRTAVSEWKERGINPAEIPALIHLADDLDVDLSGIDRSTIYQETAVTAAGNVSQYTFTDWDADGYDEMLTLNAAGVLSLYGIDETWKITSSIDTGLPGSAYTIADEDAPLILILSSGKDELLAVTGSDAKLSTLFGETGISGYEADGNQITFSQLLEGSIERYNEYMYEAVGITNRPVRTGINWQQNDYPQPANAVAAVQRYFEARAYDIPDEVILLTAEPSLPDIFTAETLSDLPVPNVPGTVDVSAYQSQDGRELFEVTYQSGTQPIHTWIAAEYLNGWKIVGAADTYGAGLAADEIDFSIPLISLNAETTNAISSKGGRNTYRLLVPSAGRIGLLWQSGSKAMVRTSHTVTMYRGSLTGDTVFSFELQPSPNKQQSKDMFVSAGIYYVTVEAGIADTEQYHLTITYDAETHVELENNDTSAKATPVELNTGYSGTLSGAKDIDFYSFSLDETSAVNVTFGIPGNGSKTSAYTITVFSASSGDMLSTISVPGNAQLSETGNLYLSPDTYLVQVTKGSTFTNDTYILTVNVFQNGIMESEPNNTTETANTIPVNEDIHASIGKEGDVDFFTFTLDGDAVIQPKFTFTPTDSTSRTYVLTIMDTGSREMLKVNIGGKESTKVITPAALTAGTYIVKIENPRFVRQDYILHLVSRAVNSTEKEPNDSASLATDLAIGQTRTGVLITDSDVDYYKVTFAEQTTVTLKFSFPQSSIKDTVFVLTIEQNGKTQWTANIKGDSGGIEQQLQFPAGEYYIRIKPSSWIGAVYTITVK